MIEKDRMSTNSSKFPKVTGSVEVEYKLKFKMFMAVIKIQTSNQTLKVLNELFNVNFENFLQWVFAFWIITFQILRYDN
jgi:hypothetical protein